MMVITLLQAFYLLLVPAEMPKSVHEFHLSKCDIDFSPDESSLQIAVSIFIDDLELALSKDGFDSLRLCSNNEADIAEQVIMDYIGEHIQISVDDVPQKLLWVGKEISEDLAAVWCYLEVVNVSPKKSIDVKNDVLMDLFDDQQNVVKLQYDKSRKSFFLFNKNEFTGRLDL